MRSVGQTAGSGLPQKIRPGDYERALALVAGLGNDEAVKSKLSELRMAAAEHDVAREESEAASAEAKRRDSAARQAEDRARSQREALATETAATDVRLRAEREALSRERKRLEELDKTLETEASSINLREAALRRAFDAYHEGE